LGNVLSQLALCRYFRRLGLLDTILIGFLCGFVLLLGIEMIFIVAAKLPVADCCGQLAMSGITYAALGYGYFHFVNLGETARRVRIMRELYDSRTGLSMKEILERYNARTIVDLRLARLTANGQVICRDGRYYIGKRTVLFMAKIIVALKLIVLGKRTEFD
jgi:hypothetical protein